jgi:hypothetical protein
MELRDVVFQYISTIISDYRKLDTKGPIEIYGDWLNSVGKETVKASSIGAIGSIPVTEIPPF